MLSEKTISTPVDTNSEFKDVYISQMFDFKYKEDIDICYNQLRISSIPLSEDKHEIDINIADGLIDLSPCIGTYQEAVFFNQYDIDEEIDFLARNEGKNIDESMRNESLDKKILYRTFLETKQNRYKTQVNVPVCF